MMTGKRFERGDFKNLHTKPGLQFNIKAFIFIAVEEYPFFQISIFTKRWYFKQK
jgi:hypothetical protein